MNCQEARLLIHARQDGELDAAHLLRVEEHLSGCPGCRALAQNLCCLGDALRGDDLMLRAPAALRQEFASRLSHLRRQQAAPATRLSRWRWAPALAAAALVVVLAVQQMLPTAGHGGTGPLVAEITSSHVRSLLVDHLMDVASSDRHTVKPWFDGKLSYAPLVQDMKEAGFPLLGGRLDTVADRPVAALVYGRRRHVINLFAWPAQTPTTGMQSLERNGFHLVHWTTAGQELWAVSDLNAPELEEFATTWQRAAQQ